MYLRPEAIAACEARFGAPLAADIGAPLTPPEMDRLLASQKHGRAHDVTLFIQDGEGRVVVIRKPFFPPGCWRPPSGGVDPGEEIEAGAVREALEETGLEVALVRYLARVRARFADETGPTPRLVHWTSHAFSARPVGGRLGPLDTEEIAEARWAALAELAGPIRAALEASGSGGLRYRAALHAAVLPLLGVR